MDYEPFSRDRRHGIARSQQPQGPLLPADVGTHSGMLWPVLVLLAVVSSLIYLAHFTTPMWLLQHFESPHLDTPKLLGVSEANLSRFTLTVVTLFVLYAAAFRLSFGLRSPRTVAAVLGLAALMGLPLLLMYPGGAGDVYAYIAEADVVLRYQQNPFVTAVAEIPDHPLLSFLDYPGETTHYGPLWLVLGVFLRLVSGGGLLAGLLVFKVAALGFLLGTGLLVYLTLRETRAEAAVPSALLVAWNPLLLFELAGNGHNDVAMAFFVMLAFYLHGRKAPRLSLAALLAASLIKYTAIVLVPLLLIALLRRAGPVRDWLPGAITCAAGAAVVAVALVKLVGLQGTLGVMDEQSRWFTTSPAAVAQLWLSQSLPAPEQLTALTVTRAGQFLFGVLYLVQMVRLWFRPGLLVECSYHSLLLLMLLVVSWFQPWYVTWAIPLGALAATRGSHAAAFGLSFGAFMVHAVMGFAWRLEWHRGDRIVLNAAGAGAAWIPAACGFLVARITSR